MVSLLSIESKRKQLIECVIIHGLTSDLTLERSKELDELIIQYQALQNEE
ncbi:aspartyl-phosphate phosphatase Spo0E family protein [Salipaludibacillus sp. HK11]